MKHIYYKNDFAVEITLLNASGEVVAPPDWQWHIEFTDGRRKYICSVDKGNAKVVGNTIMCYLDNHKFCCGEIGYKFVQAIPDLNYLDGFQNLITPKALPIELWEQESDNDVNIQSSVVPAYVVYDAYQTAKANGYTGTAEEFYDALIHIVDINTAEAERVEAEANRVTAEQQRVENFVAMESALTTATNKANTATTKAEEASKRANNSATAASQATTQATTATKRANDISADLEAKREADYWRGEKGDKGDKGDTGEKGDKGERGLQGVQGVKGDDGVSPTVTTSKTGKVTTIEITDANGVHTATVNDGESVEVVQSTGTSTTSVMSQKAVSDALSNVYTKAESDARYMRGEVLYEDYYYPNMSPTTDTTRFTDSTEILQPTKFIESYTDANGVSWNDVFECENFPDWFECAERNCYPYGNGYSTGYLFLHNFAVENNGLVYNFDTLQNNNIGQKFPYSTEGLGLKRIDATHFKVYNKKAGTTEFTLFDKANVDCSLFAFSPVTYNPIYDVDDCKLVRITLTGNIQSPSRYSSLLQNTCDVGLIGYYYRQVLYGDEYVEIEIDKNNNRWRQVKSGYSMFYRSGHSQNWNANKPESYESECRCLWSNIPNGTVRNICMINKKICFSFTGLSNPSTLLRIGCKIKIEKLA